MSDYLRFQSLKPVADFPQLMAMWGARRKAQNSLAPQSGWYSIKNLSESQAEIFIYEEIGFFGVSANDFAKELRDVRASNITLRINSPGGEVTDGITIYNALRRHPATVNVFVDGIAASAASFVAMAGDEVVMAPHSQIFIHDAHGFSMGNAADLRSLADTLDKFSNEIAGIYAERAGGGVEAWRDRMKAETWFSDQEAVDTGLADRIEGQAKPTNRRDPEPKPDEEPDPVPTMTPAQMFAQLEEEAALVA